MRTDQTGKTVTSAAGLAGIVTGPDPDSRLRWMVQWSNGRVMSYRSNDMVIRTASDPIESAVEVVEDDPIAEFEAIQAEIYADLDERARHLAAADEPTMPDDPSEQFGFPPIEDVCFLFTPAYTRERPYGYDGGRCVECGSTDGGHYGNCEAVN